jgi:hypothetical protein
MIRVFNDGLLLGSSITESQHLSEGWFTGAFDESKNLVFRLKLRLSIRDDDLLSTNNRNED